MMNINMINTVEKFDALLAAQKAVDRYLYQYDLCVSIKSGTCTKFHDTFEEEMAKLLKRKAWAKYKVLDLQSQVKVLDRVYNLKSGKDVKNMLFDFADMVNQFLYEMELEEKAQ